MFILIVAFSLAVLWFSAAWQKLSAFEVFAATLADYRIVPRGLVKVSSVSLAGFEFVLGAAVLTPMTRNAALIASAVMLITYAAAMGINLLRGRRHIDCGCMGPVARQSLSGWLLVRNALLAALALVVAISPGSRDLIWLDFFTVAAGVAAAAMTYTTVNHLIANGPNLAQLRY